MRNWCLEIGLNKNTIVNFNKLIRQAILEYLLRNPKIIDSEGLIVQVDEILMFCRKYGVNGLPGKYGLLWVCVRRSQIECFWLLLRIEMQTQ